MKRLISVLLIVFMLFTFTTTAMAQTPSNVSRFPVEIDGTIYYIETTTFNPNQSDEYNIIRVTSATEEVVYDDRTNYMMINGEKTVVFADSISTRASRPTSIDHGIDIDPMEWGYIKSSWYHKQFTDYIWNLAEGVLIAGISSMVTGSPITLSPLIVERLVTAVKDADTLTEDKIYWRVYTYGKIGHLNYQGHIGQLYTSDYEIIEGSVVDQLV